MAWNGRPLHGVFAYLITHCPLSYWCPTILCCWTRQLTAHYLRGYIKVHPYCAANSNGTLQVTTYRPTATPVFLPVLLASLFCHTPCRLLHGSAEVGGSGWLNARLSMIGWFDTKRSQVDIRSMHRPVSLFNSAYIIPISQILSLASTRYLHKRILRLHTFP